MALIVARVLDTWPKVLLHNAETAGVGAVAIRYKHYGIWQGTAVQSSDRLVDVVDLTKADDG